MEQLIQLRILLPSKVFLVIENVKRIVAETTLGQVGFLPQRLDCVAALVPGIFIYQTEIGPEKYVAIDKGVMIKAGTTILVSVRNAIGGADLGKLHESVDKEFKQLDDNEKNVRQVMAKMESSFMLRLHKFQQD